MRRVIGGRDRAAAGVEARVAQLAARYRLDTVAARQLRLLVELLASDRLAPTTVRDPDRVLDDHLADSLVALDLPEVRTAEVIADLGSGPGFPGLVLAIALPFSQVTLVESSRRKCEFIQKAIVHCEVRNASVANTRAEAWTDGIGRVDLVTARALAHLDVVAEYAAPLLRTGGTLVAWRGRRDSEAEAAAASAAATLGLEPGDVVPVFPYSGAEFRHLHLFSKVAPTPPGFPRRPGMARKRPLGGRPHF